MSIPEMKIGDDDKCCWFLELETGMKVISVLYMLMGACSLYWVVKGVLELLGNFTLKGCILGVGFWLFCLGRAYAGFLSFQWFQDTGNSDAKAGFKTASVLNLAFEAGVRIWAIAAAWILFGFPMMLAENGYT